MALLDNIQFTREKLNALYHLGLRYKKIGPEAPMPNRWLFYLLHHTPWGSKWEKIILETIYQFQREFLNLQRSSLIPPSYWDSEILNCFEGYILHKRAWTLEECIELYESEGHDAKQPEVWELLYLKKVKI